MEISIIIATYNRAGSLQRTLEAVGSQTLPADTYEVIVVDDGSSDNTGDTVAKFIAEHPRLSIRYERHTANRLKAAACRTGLLLARGRLVVFTDDDIRPVPQWLEAHVGRHSGEGRTVSVTGLVQYPEEWSVMSNWIHFANQNYLLNFTLEKTTNGGLPPSRFAGGNTSVPREVLVRAGKGPDGLTRADDLALGCRLYEMGVPLVFEPKALVYHHADSIRSIDGTLRSFHRGYASTRKILREHYPYFYEKFGHWFLEPINADEDDIRRQIAKSLVRLLALRSVQRGVVRYLRCVDGIRWLYSRRLHQYVMACEALDAIRSSTRELSGPATGSYIIKPH